MNDCFKLLLYTLLSSTFFLPYYLWHVISDEVSEGFEKLNLLWLFLSQKHARSKSRKYSFWIVLSNIRTLNTNAVVLLNENLLLFRKHFSPSTWRHIQCNYFLCKKLFLYVYVSFEDVYKVWTDYQCVKRRKRFCSLFVTSLSLEIYLQLFSNCCQAISVLNHIQMEYYLKLYTCWSTCAWY